MGKDTEKKLTFHDYQLEINRLEAKAKRQQTTLERTWQLIRALKQMQGRGEAQ